MDGLFTLLSLSIVMATASFLAGMLPLSLSLSQAQLRLISTIGMGVLVGTSLIVIIPEGVETLYRSSSISHLHKRDLMHTRTVSTDVFHTEITQLVPRWPSRELRDEVDPFAMPGPVVPDSLDAPPKTPTKPGVVGIMGSEDSHSEAGSNGKEGSEAEKEKDIVHVEDSPHAWIGIALIAGFMLMYLIDKLPRYTSPTKPRSRTHHIALNNLGRRFNVTTSLDRDEEADSFLEQAQGPQARQHGFATTTGLVIHAAADGIALGASSSAKTSGLSLIIFFAIMVHKAPAAFGLTSVLLKQGLSKRTARAHLLLFSLAAPSGALLTWFLAHLLGAGMGGNARKTTFWTGVLLLFSAGTFLYVAMHSMQEVSTSHQETHMNGHTGNYADGRDGPPPEAKPSVKDLGAACFGMILPLFLQIGHAH